MKTAKRPPALQTGDTVVLLGLASAFDYEKCVPPAIKVLESWGLKVRQGRTLTQKWKHFAGDDTLRTTDFQEALDDPTVRAIFSVRGGYGSSRILENIDYSRFKKAPKWVIGFSDITAVLCDIYRLGFEGLHATMPKLFFQDKTGNSLESLRQMLFGSPVFYQTPPNPANRFGQGEGPLVGGNLCLLAHLLGSRSAIATKGKILFLEEVEEYHYAIDRYLVQLRRAGMLENLAGLVVGSFSELKDNSEDFGQSVTEMVTHWTRDYAFPIAFGFPVGHEAANLAMPVGRKAWLGVDASGVKLRFEE